MNKLNYKLLKPGARSQMKFGDQIWEVNYWRDTNRDFTVEKNWKTRRPDKESLKLIKQIKEQIMCNQKIIWAANEFIYGSPQKARKQIKESLKEYESIQ